MEVHPSQSQSPVQTSSSSSSVIVVPHCLDPLHVPVLATLGDFGCLDGLHSMVHTCKVLVWSCSLPSAKYQD
jgi:hypothetical protein